LRAKLPDYMIPAAFVTLDTLPLTPNGKVDRRALQQMTTGVLLATTLYVPPTTPTEMTLVDIWATVLKLDPSQIGTHHNFFDLGGHSLLAVQVLSRVRTAFAVELPIRDLMDNPTIAGIAAALQPMQQLATLFQALPADVAAERESIEL
jgi:acyl carrier protein